MVQQRTWSWQLVMISFTSIFLVLTLAHWLVVIIETTICLNLPWASIHLEIYSGFSVNCQQYSQEHRHTCEQWPWLFSMLQDAFHKAVVETFVSLFPTEIKVGALVIATSASSNEPHESTRSPLGLSQNHTLSVSTWSPCVRLLYEQESPVPCRTSPLQVPCVG